MTITTGIGNFTWYEFIGYGVNSTPAEMEGTVSETFETPFNQTMWDSLNNGTATIRFYVNNSLGEIGYLDAIIRIDIIDPTLNIIAPTGGYFNSTPPSYTIEISDPNIDTRWYTLNANQTRHIFTSNGTIQGWKFLNDGLVTITFYANDSMSNQNSDLVQVTKDIVDPEAPSSLTSDPSSWANVDNFDLSWSNPADTSGIVGAYYKLDSVPTTDTDGTYVAGADIESITGISVTTDGTHTVYVWLIDNAGNIDYTNYASTQLYLDTTDPSSPSSLGATPASWTNVDSFDLSWTNPADTSGIIGAYYKLDALPTTDTDGTNVAGADIESITGITVTTDGTHTVYVWLVDDAGNIDYTSYASIQLYLDTTDPSTPSSLAATPISWTNTDNFDISWSNPADTSGIVGAYYKLDTAPTTDTDGTYVAGVDIESIMGITVTTDGTHTVYVWLVDDAGNIDYTSYANTQLYLDTTDPSSPSSLSATPISWTNVDSFDLSWSNPADTSGIVGAYYKLDAVPTTDTDGTYVAGADIEFITGISVTTDGTHTIYVWLVDDAGNIDYTSYTSTQLYLDTIDPSSPSSLGATPASWTNVDDFDLSWSNPADTSGIVGAYYKLDAAPTSDADGTYVAGADIESITGITVTTDGTHTVYVWLVDDAGNIDYTSYASIQLYLDTTDPSSPSSLAATPISWTNVDSFNLSWSNPADTSGIVGAYYKLDAVPTTDTDGTYVAGADIESITGISVTTDGTHTVYVWLVDDAGNIEYANYASTQLYLDTTDPSSPSSLGATPASWTNVDSFNLSWSNPADTSGIVGAYYKLDAAPTTDTDGTYVAGVDIESIIGITVTTDGTHTVYVWLVDDAGNIDYMSYTSTQLYLDTTDPSSPSSLAATPISWTNVDSFDLSWSNPADTSGIVGAYYKLDAVPTTDTDGTYVAGVDIESISGITVTTDGTHTVYVWLVDDAGNVDYTSQVSTQLYLDTTDPSPPTGLVVNPSSWTNIDSFNFSWSNPTDTSGISGVFYKFNSVPTSNNDGIYVAGSDIESLIDISIGSDGTHTIYFWLNDTAGNIDYNNYVSAQLYLDTTDPTSPSSLGATPISWTNIDSFDLSWSNPADTSGIVGAYYKLNAVPTTDTDGTYQAGIDIESITGISVITDGVHTVYVWLVDDAGNVDYMSYTTTQLHLDTTDPIIILNNPINNTYYNSPPPINITVYEPNPSVPVCTYTVTGPYSPINNPLDNNTEISFNQGIWDALPEGEFEVVFTSFDILGHRTDLILTLYKDTQAPTVTINFPGNSTYWNLAPNISVSAIDPNFDTVWYSVNSINIILTNDTTQQLNETIWNSLPDEGDFEVKIFANDSFGHLNDLYSLVLYKDVVIPTLIINSPLNNTYHKLSPFLNAVVMDPYFDSLWYRVGVQEVALVNDTDQQLTTSIWNGLDNEGNFVIYFYANDSAGNLNSIFSLNLNKDIRNPVIIINNPHLDDLFGDPAPDFDLSINELNLDETWYMLYNQTWNTSNYTFSGLTGTIDQLAWEEFGNTNVTIRFYANDTLDNLGYSEVTIRKNIIAPILTIVDPSNYDLFGIEAPNITIYKAGTELDTTWYTLDGTNFTFSGLNVVLNQAAWDNYGFEDVIIIIYLNDSLGRIGSDQLTLRKDPNPPEIFITFIIPPGNNSYYNEAPTFRITVYEPNIDSIWYRVGATNITVVNNTIIILNDTIWNGLSQGKFTIEVFAKDILGYLNDSITLTFYKDTLAPSLVINQPYDGNYYDSSPPINITVYDPNFLPFSLTYTVIGYLPDAISLDNNTEVLLNSAIWNNLPQGEFLVSITARDTFNQRNDTFVLTLYKDTIAPIFDSLIPINFTVYNSTPGLRISYIDPRLDTIYYKVGTSSIITIPDNTLQDFDLSIWSGLNEGPFTIEFYANDTFGHTSTVVNLTLIKDTVLPLVIVNSPINGTYYSDAPIMNIGMSDLNPGSVWYTLIGTKVLLSGAEPLDGALWDSLDQGEFQVYIFANDSAGNLNNSIMLTLLKDTLAPLVTVNLPLNNTYWNSPDAITINVEAFDPNLNTIYYYVAGGYGPALESGNDTTLIWILWDDLEEGPFTMQIFASDTFGQTNSSIILTLHKDTIEPTIEILSPQPNDLIGETTPFVSLNISDTNLEETLYRLSNGTVVTNYYPWTGSIEQAVWDQVGNGTVTIRFYANDTATNEHFEEVVVRKNIYAPIISINYLENHSPYDNELFGITSPGFEIYKSGSDLQSTWYTIDNGITNFTFTGLLDTINQTAWDAFGFEPVTLTFYINDSLGKIGTYERIVRKDPDIPTIDINSPVDQTPHASPPLIDLTVTEPNLHKVWYSINGDTRDITNNLTILLDLDLWENLPQGQFRIDFFANDTIGNLNNLMHLDLSKDTIGPFITIIRPTPDQLVGRTAPYFEVSITDINGMHSSWYRIIGYGNNTLFTGPIDRLHSPLWESIWDSLPQGSPVTIRFFSNDTLGNRNYTDVQLIIYKPSDPTKLMLYPFLFLFPLVGLVAMVPFTRKLTRTRYYRSLNTRDKKKLKNALITAGFFLVLLTVYFII